MTTNDIKVGPNTDAEVARIRELEDEVEEQ